MTSPSDAELPSPSDAAESDTRVLVVGGRGFVGSHIVRRLLGQGARVHVFGPPMADDLLADLGGRFGETQGSVEDRAALGEALARSGADRIVTVAAHSAGRQGLMRSGDAEGDAALAVNVVGLRNVLEVAQAAGVTRVVWTSSTVVYGPAESYPAGRVDEGAPRAPRTFYGLTKVLAEDVAAYYRDRHGLDVVALRLPLVLGPGLWYAGAASAIADLVRAAASGAAHEVAFHDEAMDLAHVADAADAVALALAAPGALDPIYNLVGFTARLSDMVRTLGRRVPGYAVTHRPEPPALTFPLVDDARFRRDTGFAPRYGVDAVIDDLLPTDTTSSEASCTSNA